MPGVSPLWGGSFAASFGRGPYVRGGCRARQAEGQAQERAANIPNIHGLSAPDWLSVTTR